MRVRFTIHSSLDDTILEVFISENLSQLSNVFKDHTFLKWIIEGHKIVVQRLDD